MSAGQLLQSLAVGLVGNESEEYNQEDPAVSELQQCHLSNLIPGISVGPLPSPSSSQAATFADLRTGIAAYPQRQDVCFAPHAGSIAMSVSWAQIA
jgi:hypothetical protein